MSLLGVFDIGILSNFYKIKRLHTNTYSESCNIYIIIYASPPPQDPYFYMLAFPKTYNTVHPVHLACLEAKYLVPEGFTVLRIFFFNRALPGSSC